MNPWGIHINAIKPWMVEWIRQYQPGWLKILDHNSVFIQEAKAANPDMKIIGRKWYSEGDQDRLMKAGADGAREMFGNFQDQSTWPYIDIWEDINEPGSHPTYGLMQLQINIGKLLHSVGRQNATGGWSAGTPDIPDWSSTWFWLQFVEADYIHAHEYCAPRWTSEFDRHPDDPDINPTAGGYFTLRHKKWYPQLPAEARKPLIISECLIDSGAAHWDPGAQGGFHSFTSVEDYCDQLAQYLTYCDSAVVAVIPFCFGTADQKWDSFDLGSDEHTRTVYGQFIQGWHKPEIPQGWIDLRSTLKSNYNSPYGQFDIRELSTIKKIVIHHSAVPPSVGPVEIHRVHTQDNQWFRIGYHFTIDETGKIYWVNSLEYQGAHVYGHNVDTIGVCLQGDFTNVVPPESQLKGARNLIRDLRNQLGDLEVQFHREIAEPGHTTECPGNTYLQWKDKLLDTTSSEIAELREENARLNVLLAQIEEIAQRR